MVTLRTGELMILAGESGAGKSTVAVNWAVRTDVPVLYFAQENPHEVKRRMTALALGQRTSDISNDNAEHYKARLTGKHDTLVVVRRPQTLEVLNDWLLAMHEWLMGEPFIVFIDNVKDLDVRGDIDPGNNYYDIVLPMLKQLAISRGCLIVGLHHANRAGAEGLGVTPLTLGRLLYGGDRDARHVWGVYHPDDRHMNVQILKNNDGRADPNGNLYVSMDWRPEAAGLYSA